MLINIVLLPPKELSEKIGRFVRKLSKIYKLQMAVDNKKLLPHISLLHIKTLPSRLSAIIETIKAISQKHQAKPIKLAKPKIGSDYFASNLAQSKTLMALHKEVVLKIHQFKTGFSSVGNRKGKRLERLYIKKYGAGNILKYFQPHITLGIVKNPRDLSRIKPVLSKLRFRGFKSNRLALTQVNSRHQVFKIIKEFKLHE